MDSPNNRLSETITFTLHSLHCGRFLKKKASKKNVLINLHSSVNRFLEMLGRNAKVTIRRQVNSYVGELKLRDQKMQISTE